MGKLYKASFTVNSLSIIFSCSSKKEILYFQDIENNQNLSTNYKEYLIKPGDILKIKLMLDRVDDQIIEYDNFNRSMTRESQIIVKAGLPIARVQPQLFVETLSQSCLYRFGHKPRERSLPGESVYCIAGRAIK